MPTANDASERRHRSPGTFAERTSPTRSHIAWASAAILSSVPVRFASGRGAHRCQASLVRPARPLRPLADAVDLNPELAITWPARRAGVSTGHEALAALIARSSSAVTV